MQFISTMQLAHVTGGSATDIAGRIGNFIDGLTGGTGRATKVASHIGGIIDAFKQPQGQAPAPQGQAPQG